MKTGATEKSPYIRISFRTGMRLASLTVLALTALLPIAAAAGTITVKPGETLSDIAARYGVSMTALMRLNGISNPDHVEIGSRLKVPGTGSEAGSGRHTVKSGETLLGIASLYQVRSRDLIAVNGLQDADHVELGQTLKLPTNAVIPSQRPKPAPIKAVPGALEHTVGKGQTLSQIARAYQVPVASLISINSLDNPDQVTVGTRLYLKPPAGQAASANAGASIGADATPVASVIQDSASGSAAVTTTQQQKAPVQQVAAVQKKPAPKVSPKPKATQSSAPKAKTIAKAADWRSYGPLQVDWANWQPMDGSHVVPTLNAQGQALYLAINCSAGKLNVTGADGAWKAWAAPQSSFEKDLMKDRCKASVRT